MAFVRGPLILCIFFFDDLINKFLVNIVMILCFSKMGLKNNTTKTHFFSV